MDRLANSWSAGYTQRNNGYQAMALRTNPLLRRRRSQPRTETGTRHDTHELSAWTNDRKLASGFGMNVVGGIVSAGSGLAFTVLIAHALPVAEVGVLFEAIAVFSILIVATQLGTGGTIVKTISEYRAVGRTADIPSGIRAALVPTAVVSIAVGIALFAFAPLLATELVNHGNRQHETVYLRTLAPFVPIGALLAVLLAATRGAGTMVPTVLIDSIAKPLLRALVAVIAALTALSPLALGALWAAPLAAGFAAAGLVLLQLVRRLPPDPTSRGLPRAMRPRSVTRDYWRFTAPQWLAEIFQLAVLWIDVVLVGALASASDAGIYGAVSRLVTVGTLGLAAALLVLGPEFSAILARGDLDRLQALYRRSTLWLAVGSMPIFLLLATFAPVIVNVFGSGYESGAQPLSILSIAMLIAVVVGPSSLTLLMGGRSKLLLANSAAGFFANVGLNFVLIPRYGVSGAAIAWSMSIVLTSLLSVVQIRRLWVIRPFDRNLALICIAATACFGAVGVVGTHLGGSNVPTFLVSAMFGALLYGVALWWMRSRLELPGLVTRLRATTP